MSRRLIAGWILLLLLLVGGALLAIGLLQGDETDTQKGAPAPVASSR